MANGNEKAWTIMVYMAGDNNLSEYMAYALGDIGDVCPGLRKPSDNNVNLLAFIDSSSLTTPSHYIDYSGGKAERHPIEEEDEYYPKRKEPTRFQEENREYGENSASAYSIMNFVHWCVNKRECNAKNYALIFSGHSFGFHGTSFLRDDSSGSYLTIFKFRWALEEVNKIIGQEIAILGFDSCVMSMLEVGYELKATAKTMVASEGSLPNSGWGYSTMLQNFVAGETPPSEQASDDEKDKYIKDTAKGFVKKFIDEQSEYAIGGRSVDIATWDLKKVPAVTEAVNELAIELNKHLYLVDKVENKTLIDKDILVFQLLKKSLLQAHFDCQTYMREQCIDIKDFCQKLIIECKYIEGLANSLGDEISIFRTIKEKCKNVILATEECILLSGFVGEEYQFSNGISLYFPWTYVTYFITDFRYRYLRFCKGDSHGDWDKGKGKDWNLFLRNYLTRVTLRFARKRKEGKDWKISEMENFNQGNMLWSKDNPIASKDNPIWSKDNPIASKDNPIASKDNPIASKDNPIASKDNPPYTKGEVGEYLFYFSRFKNFQLCWDITGYSCEFKFDRDFEEISAKPEKDTKTEPDN